LPLAGVYETYMVPNNHADEHVRFDELGRAIRAVYASLFTAEARTYAASHPHASEQEKMAVVIQEVVGSRHGSRYYPHVSGVAQSYNYYPIGQQRAEDGVAVIALGLGHVVVTGNAGLRFCPACPTVLPQFPEPRHVLRYTQRQFCALDMERPLGDLTGGPTDQLAMHELDVAERDGMLALAGSVYVPGDDVIREGLSHTGPRVVTFNNLLKWRAVPLAEALQELLAAIRTGMGAEVEIEFAVDMADWGKPPPRGRFARLPRLYVLQARPMAHTEGARIDIDAHLPANDSSAGVLCRSERALGNGRIDDIRDIVWVPRTDLDSGATRAAALGVRALDERLRAAGRSYLLIGPGRWGSSDPSLGIPVAWTDIAGARVIVELPLRGEYLEPSQGTHFFHNVTSARLGYLTVIPEANGYLDETWLAARDHSTDLVAHLELDHPLCILLDGRTHRAAILEAPPP
jgi:hypothetical protein